MTQRYSYAANLAFLAFGHGDAQYGLARCAFDDGDHTWRSLALILQPDSFLPAVQGILVWQSSNRHLVGFGVAVAWMRQFMSEVAVIGEDDQPFAVGVESSNGEQVPLMRHEVEHRQALVTSMNNAGREYVPGFVQRQINLVLLLGKIQTLPIDLDHVGFRIGFIAQSDKRAIHADAPFHDQFFGGAAGCNIRLRH